MDSYLKRLETILGEPPQNLWTAILPQLILWCFRRFFLKTLDSSAELAGSLITEAWGDFLDLVDRYAPTNLKSSAALWLNPDVVASCPLSLDALDSFLRDLVKVFDNAIRKEEDDVVADLAIFLDEQVPTALRDWLGDVYAPLYFFPQSSTEEEDFTEDQKNALALSVGEFILFGHIQRVGEPLVTEVKERPPVKLRRAQAMAYRRTHRARRSGTPPKAAGKFTRRSVPTSVTLQHKE
jgi:hypothetical protein